MNKSPLNYIGGKYRLLNQILPLFPEGIHTFVDLFAGGLDVSLNIEAQQIVSNDINHYVIGLYEYFQGIPLDTLLADIEDMIQAYGLSKTNDEGYVNLRNEYNRTHSPLLLFGLICYGFNHQIRYNSRGDFNNPFGKNRSSYNRNIEKNLREMHPRLNGIQFTTLNFRNFPIGDLHEGDFLYADPPYLITCGSYNDGKRGFEGWTIEDDQLLCQMLDQLNAQGARFAMSNVLQHKGVENTALSEWAAAYNIHHIATNYNNSNYQAKQSETIEVLITNY